ncbi:segregation and condensation protein B [Companilactobacillus sp. RD055328]|uniref:SMC-Scp complex subunit ScpB n=1 Tax=Companilactobacillus sp. RD055328 TaxID=2916634 RepID=UPI001FC87EB8|nr:SMC-Scp complex subunit ScpB [Companilactobacillus sp. RD055328]GKQ42740.1 segregation and condensation protein B [Companilactobacillus sp. RD055328]
MQYQAEIMALLYTSGDQGLELGIMAELLEISKSALRQSLDELKINLEADEQSGLIISQFDDIYKLVTKPQFGSLLNRYFKSGLSTTLSQAALEVLSIIAYKQPVTRVEIDEIRGVQSSGTLQTLIVRQLVKENGRKNVPGKPIIYATTEQFLDYFGLKTLKELPDISEFEDSELDKDGNLDLFYSKFEKLENNEENNG